MSEGAKLVSDLASLYFGGKKMKKEYPEDYAVYSNTVQRVLREDKLSFEQISGTMASKSNILKKKGFFNIVPFESIVRLDPITKLIRVVYKPEKAVFVSSNYDAFRLMDWINGNLSCGKVTILGPIGNQLRDDLIQLVYQITLSYPELDQKIIGSILAIYLDKIKQFDEKYDDIIEATAKLKLSFSKYGQVTGESANEIKNITTAARESLAPSDNQANSPIIQDLMSLLQDIDIEFALKGKTAKSIDENEETDPPRVMLWLTKSNELIIESNKTVGIISDEFLAFSNMAIAESGSFIADRGNKAIVFRTSFPVTENKFQNLYPLVKELIKEHKTADKWLERLRSEVNSGFKGNLVTVGDEKSLRTVLIEMMGDVFLLDNADHIVAEFFNTISR